MNTQPEYAFDALPSNDVHRTFVGAIVGTDGRPPFRFLGSGFLIGENLALTARHVTDDAHKQFVERTRDIPPGGWQNKFRLEFGTVDAMTGLTRRWAIHTVYRSPMFDVAVLDLDPLGEPAKLQPYPELNLAPPRPGDRVSAFGYPMPTVRVDPDMPEYSKLSPHLYRGGGVVQEVHDTGRDRLLLPFPCFHTTAPIQSGMSGGPVTNAAGQVCGVVCRSFDLIEGEPVPLSYASLLWPALSYRTADTTGVQIEYVRDLALQRRARMKGLDALSIQSGFTTDHISFTLPQR
jgi:S1-C subfamily serine protease